MTQRKTTPEGDTDSDSDVPRGPSLPKDVPRIMASLDKIKAKRAKIRKGIENDFTEGVTEVKTRIIKYYKTEEAKRTEIRRKQLDRLSRAIEKKAAYEDAIINMISSLSEENVELATLMDSVHTGRQNAVNDAANSHRPERKR